MKVFLTVFANSVPSGSFLGQGLREQSREPGGLPLEGFDGGSVLDHVGGGVLVGPVNVAVEGAGPGGPAVGDMVAGLLPDERRGGPVGDRVSHFGLLRETTFSTFATIHRRPFVSSSLN